jgi:hypothetical protein
MPRRGGRLERSTACPVLPLAAPARGRGQGARTRRRQRPAGAVRAEIRLRLVAVFDVAVEVASLPLAVLRRRLGLDGTRRAEPEADGDDPLRHLVLRRRTDSPLRTGKQKTSTETRSRSAPRRTVAPATLDRALEQVVADLRDSEVGRLAASGSSAPERSGRKRQSARIAAASAGSASKTVAAEREAAVPGSRPAGTEPAKQTAASEGKAKRSGRKAVAGRRPRGPAVAARALRAPGALDGLAARPGRGGDRAAARPRRRRQRPAARCRAERACRRRRRSSRSVRMSPASRRTWSGCCMTGLSCPSRYRPMTVTACATSTDCPIRTGRRRRCRSSPSAVAADPMSRRVRAWSRMSPGPSPQACRSLPSPRASETSRLTCRRRRISILPSARSTRVSSAR